MLGVSGKARADPNKDFMLSHLGYWSVRGRVRVGFGLGFGFGLGLT